MLQLLAVDAKESKAAAEEKKTDSPVAPGRVAKAKPGAASRAQIAALAATISFLADELSEAAAAEAVRAHAAARFPYSPEFAAPGSVWTPQTPATTSASGAPLTLVDSKDADAAADAAAPAVKLG